MKRSITYLIFLAVALSSASCVVQDEAANPYMLYGPRDFADATCKYILESAVNALEQKVDNENVFKDGPVTVYDQYYNTVISINKMEGADSTWVITDAIPEEGGTRYHAYCFNPARLHYTLYMKLLEQTEDNGFHSWNAVFTGEYDEGDGFTASYKTLYDGIRMFWKKSQWNDTVQFSLTGDGSCAIDIFKNGTPVETTYFHYRR